ncbi:MAG: hypothetical protein ACI870_000313 [Crocinitomicaceae bacterium]|jgi:hypothetical protein
MNTLVEFTNRLFIDSKYIYWGDIVKLIQEGIA